MKINSLEQMETIVENSSSLRWNGWDVVEINKSPTAWMKPNGVYVENEWHIQKLHNLKFDGWDIPSKFVRKDAK